MTLATFATSGSTEIRPFRVEIPQADIDDLKRRLADTRWPEKETVADHSQGVPLATMQQLVAYWRDEYDMRRVEARLNALPQFLTRIDDLDIHFIHVTSPKPDALPLLITHGWPGSVVEMLDVAGPLADPAAHGGDASGRIPSRDPVDAGLRVLRKAVDDGVGSRPHRRRVDRADGATRVHAVCRPGWRLGRPDHRRHGVEGAGGLLGIHSNMPGTVPTAINKTLASNVLGSGDPKPTGLSPKEQRGYDRLWFLFTKGLGYSVEMSNRPQTLYGLADSPVALAAWMLDHDALSLEDIASAFAGKPVGNLSRDEVLDNITLTWLTNTGISSGRLYWENTLAFFDRKGVTVPAAVSVFPRELYQAPRSWAEGAYPKLSYFHELDRGNHFAAWQEPELFTTEVRAAFRSLR